MSAPTAACAIADAMGPLCQALCASLGANVRIDWFPEGEGCRSFWNVSIHDHGKCFAASDYESPSAALLKANSARQAWAEQTVERIAS